MNLYSSVGMVRAGEKAHLYPACIEQGFVTIGWFHTPPRDMSRWQPDDILHHMSLDYPIGGPHRHRDGTTSVWTAAKVTRDSRQISAFLFDMNPGQLVTVASPSMDVLSVGVVTHRYEFRRSSTLGDVKDPYLHFKKVNWLGSIERREMSDYLALYIVNRRYQTVFWYDETCAEEIAASL